MLLSGSYLPRSDQYRVCQDTPHPSKVILTGFSLAVLSTNFINNYSNGGHEKPLLLSSPNSNSLEQVDGSVIKNWPELRFSWELVLVTVIGFLGSACGTVGWVGGGGIFVPMLTLIVGFDTKSAAALSKCMIMGASASSVWYNLRVPHPCRDKPILDYDLAFLFQPMLMLGITLGVSLSVVFPYWLITVLIIILFMGMEGETENDGQPGLPEPGLCEQPGTSVEPVPKRRARKPTRMARLTLRYPGKVKILFDLRRFMAIGPRKKITDNFRSYLGFLGRKQPSILINSWKHVSANTKELIWQAILLAFEAYHVVKGLRSNTLSMPKWVYPKVLPTRRAECGLFVMRHMLEIIKLDIANSFEKVLNMEKPYSSEDNDDVRRRWAECFLEVI
ncbi:hypothetical protein CASFOL_009492 [Castilleja foliolosa]|uniref:Sulfite exporter TauE/SafE family protein n=1 Tax=Castilleja foliolosa TaxID=1961234 RepID=A0ABD3DXH2_9LAMI